MSSRATAATRSAAATTLASNTRISRACLARTGRLSASQPPRSAARSHSRLSTLWARYTTVTPAGL